MLQAVFGLAVLLVSLVLASRSGAAPGDLDLAFGDRGIATIDFGEYPCEGRVCSGSGARNLSVAPDGKIVVVGGGAGFTVVRFTAEGQLDPSFGFGGIVIIENGEETTCARCTDAESVFHDAQGRVIAVGTSFVRRFEGRGGISNAFTLAAFLEDGGLDPNYGSGGIVKTVIGESSSAQAAVMDPSGRTLVAGNSSGIALARYLPDGTLDQTFGSGGTLIGSAQFDMFVRSVALQGDGKIVLAGSTVFFGSPGWTLQRYTAEGNRDESFGTQGRVETFIGERETAVDVAVQADGKIVVVGNAFLPDLEFPALLAMVRYEEDGGLDFGFGDGGIVTTRPAPFQNGGSSLALQRDGKIIMGANVNVDGLIGTDEAALLRYRGDGTLDAAFGRDGIVITQVGSGFDDWSSVVVQPDGKIVATGPASADFSVARYEGGDTDRCGDADGNGAVDVLDGTNVARAAVGLGSACDRDSAACDVDDSGTIDVIDAANVARAAVGLPSVCG